MANKATSADHLRTTFKSASLRRMAAISFAFGDNLASLSHGRIPTGSQLVGTGPEPPPGQRKTAGRAATLRSGSMNSYAAILESYRSSDSCASAVCKGGRK